MLGPPEAEHNDFSKKGGNSPIIPAISIQVLN
jgi:hypothetical protein